MVLFSGLHTSLKKIIIQRKIKSHRLTIHHTMGEVQTYWNPLRKSKHLQTGAVDDLVVDNELTATVVDDKGTDGATAIGEGLGDALVEATLGDDLETLLDITGLGHGDEAVVVTDVQDAVGLEDGAEHGLHND